MFSWVVVQFDPLYYGVILSAAVFQAERRISRLTGPERQLTAPLPSVGTARDLRRSHMLGPDAHSNHASRNTPEERPSLHQLQRPWNSNGAGTRENAPDHKVLHQYLHPLRDTGRKLPAALNSAKVVITEAACDQPGA